MRVFFDIESTGVDTAKDRIVELSIIKMDGKKIVEQYLQKFNPEMSIPLEASLVHGIYDMDIIGCPKFREEAATILKFIEGCDIAGYNIIRFDVPMLFNELFRAGITWDYTAHMYNDVYKTHQKIDPSNLGAVYKKWTGKEMENAHTAQADVMATIELSNLFEEKFGMGDRTELHTIAVGETPLLDLNNKFKYDSKGRVIFNFGAKHKGKVVYEAEKYAEYLQWMLDPKQEFTEDVRMICRKLLNRQL